MMEKIANDIARKQIQSALSEIQKTAYIDSYQNFMHELSFDVCSAVKVAFENGKTIFEDSKTQEVIAKHIMTEIEKQFRSLKQ